MLVIASVVSHTTHSMWHYRRSSNIFKSIPKGYKTNIMSREALLVVADVHQPGRHLDVHFNTVSLFYHLTMSKIQNSKVPYRQYLGQKSCTSA